METTKQKEKEVKKIILQFDDGSTEEIEKGLVATFKENDTATLRFVDIGGQEITKVVWGMSSLGEELGMFNDENN